MIAGSVILPVLLASGNLFPFGASSIFSGGYGGLTGYGGFGGLGGLTSSLSGVLGGQTGYMCGQSQCMTQIQCNNCDYPQPFVQQVSYSRSILSRVEEFIQSIGRVAINVPSRMVSTTIAIPEGLVEVSIRNGMMLVNDIATAIENLNSYLSHQVVGRVAYDVVADLSDSLSVVRKLMGWCSSVNSGSTVIPIPQEIVIRYQQPRYWNQQCTGAWPCSNIKPYTVSQGQQSQYSNKYGYQKQYNRGSTQILNSNYDLGSASGYGDTGSGSNAYSYISGSKPSQNSGGYVPSVSPYLPYGNSQIPVSTYGSSFGGARSIGEEKKVKKSRRATTPDPDILGQN